MYQAIYNIPFCSINGIPCEVLIEKKDYTGKVKELKGGESSFLIDVDNGEFLYLPLRLSSAKLRLVGDDYLRELYSTNYQQFRVLFKRNNEIVWRGFIKPEVYTQDYVSSPFELEVECISAMSTLEYIKYSTVYSYKDQVSLFDLLKRFVVESNGAYKNIYLPHVYSTDEVSYNSDENVFESMLVLERNFFDEDDEAMNMKEILENICKLFGWALHDWLGDLYFVDIDHNGKYRKYNSDFSSFEEINISKELCVQQVGFAGSNHTLSVLGGYNKCSVKTSNYCITGDNLIDDLDLNKKVPDVEFDSSYTKYKWYYLNGNTWKNHLFKYTTGFPTTYKEYSEEEIREDVIKNYGSGLLQIPGSSFFRSASFFQATNYDYTDYIQIRFDFAHSFGYMSPILDILCNGEACAYAQGAFEITADLFSLNINENSYDDYSDEDVLSITTFLSIGDFYWNGSEWVNEYATFNLQWPLKQSQSNYQKIINTKKLSDPYDGLNGYCIPIPDKPIYGKLRFQLVDVFNNVIHEFPKGNISGLRIKNLSLKYYKKNDSTADEGTDRIYNNVINEEFVNELDEIELKINSYNNDGLCLSKIILNGDYLRDNLYCSIAGKLIRPEEQLIRRIISQYKTTKIKLTQVLVEDGSITPVTKLSDNYMVDRKFVFTGGTIDYYNGSFECNMIEYNEYSD